MIASCMRDTMQKNGAPPVFLEGTNASKTWSVLLKKSTAVVLGGRLSLQLPLPRSYAAPLQLLLALGSHAPPLTPSDADVSSGCVGPIISH